MQKDNYTPIHNEVIEQLCKTSMQDYEWRILMCIFRKTYGYSDIDGKRKKTDWVEYSQITEMTNISKSNISRTIKSLVKKKIITKNGKHMGFSKEFYKEKVINPDNKKLSSQITNENAKVISTATPVICPDNKKLSAIILNITKERKKLYKRKEHRRLFDYLIKQYPDKQGKEKAWERFNQQITTKKQFYAISKALRNYKHRLAANSWLQPQACVVWFNSHSKIPGKGWVNFVDEYVDPKQAIEKDIKERAKNDFWDKKEPINANH